jgi:calcium binding protein 39
MTKYITNTDNLKQQMNLLKEKSKNIQFEAFHVFKVFALIFIFLLDYWV